MNILLNKDLEEVGENLKIVPVMLKYDYGIKSRGDSLEKVAFLPALQDVAQEVVPFWLEENGFLDDKLKLQYKIIDFIESEKPDIVFFVLMQDEVSIETIEKISQKYITINWFCDDQWRFEDFTRYIAPKLTYSITTDKFSLYKYLGINCENVILSQWASFDYIENIDFNAIDYKYDISFIGSKNSTREWIIKSLENKGYHVECFGDGWKNGRVSYDEIKQIFLNTKINLNLSNSVPRDISYIFSSIKSIKSYIKSTKRIEQIKARNFEIPCCGGFQLTNYVCGIEDYFSIGNEIAVYSNIDELSLQLEYYLNNEEVRKKMTINQYKKAREYTYKENLKRVFSKVMNNEKDSVIC